MLMCDNGSKQVGFIYKNDGVDVSGSVPLSYRAVDGVLYDYSIDGDSFQDGTPTPDATVEVVGCGDRTANLLQLKDDYSANLGGVAITIEKGDITIKGTRNDSSGGRTSYLSEPFVLPAGKYAISSKAVSNLMYCLTKVSDQSAVVAVSGTGTFTLYETTEVAFGINFISGKSYDATINIMLNAGGTAMPYEPYGYKIPISVKAEDGTESVAAIYLDKPLYKIGEYADCVDFSEGVVKRYVKELVLTGDERWQYIDNCFRLLYSTIHDGSVPVTCTHFSQTIMYLLVNGGSGIAPCGGYYGSEYKGFAIRYDDLFTAVTDFKTYLAEQYNNGTPVKIYYVLATSETESVNLPQIHTFDGTNTLNITTDIKPSSVSLYRPYTEITSVLNKDGDVLFERGFTRDAVGNLPLQINNSIERSLLDYTLYGDSFQDGTPTPDVPVEVVGCGDRTANLLDLTDRYFNAGSLTDWSQEKTSSGFKLDFSTIAGVARGVILSLGRFPAGTYTLSLDQNPQLNTATLRKAGSTNNSKILTVTIDSEEDLELYVIGGKNKYTISNIMLNAGETALPYEPYGYKIPISVQSEDGTENLFNYNTVRRGYRIQWTTGADYADDTAVRSDYIAVKEGFEYKLNTAVYVLGYNTDKSYIGSWNGNSMKFVLNTGTMASSFKIPVGCAYIQILVYGSLTLSENTVLNEKGTEIITTIYLDKPLYKIGEYADCVDFSEGVVKRQIRELVLTGDEYWRSNAMQAGNTNPSYYARDYITPFKEANVEMCTHYVSAIISMSNTSYGVCVQKTFSGARYSLLIRPSNVVLEDVNAWKAYLAGQYAAGTPVKVYYVLSEPETESIDLPQIHTFDGMTTIDASTAVNPSGISVVYKSYV